MKLAFISDIHSNLTALKKALETIETYNVDEIYCLGDIVGYGPDPAPCLDLVRQHCSGSVLGNHDIAVAVGRDLNSLPSNGKVAALHNQSKLSEEDRLFLAQLPLKMTVHNCTLVHATPQSPESFVHVDSFPVLHQQFDHFDTDFCFVGHTHIPAIMSNKLGVFRVRPGGRYMINVGSIGQPRDRNPRLAFGIFDTETIQFEQVRVPYNIEEVVFRIEQEGLPRSLGSRLHRGT